MNGASRRLAGLVLIVLPPVMLGGGSILTLRVWVPD
jgi:hypothetical protein